MPGRRKSKTIS